METYWYDPVFPNSSQNTKAWRQNLLLLLTDLEYHLQQVSLTDVDMDMDVVLSW